MTVLFHIFILSLLHRGTESTSPVAGNAVRTSGMINTEQESQTSGITPFQHPFLYQCSDGSFTNIVYTCDGFRDCLDESDERDCGLVPERDRFDCNLSGHRTSAWNSCDGHRDCLHGEDENGCVERNCTVASFHVSCHTHTDMLGCVSEIQSKKLCLDESLVRNRGLKGNGTEQMREYNECEEHGFINSYTNDRAPSSCSTPCRMGQYRCRASGQCISNDLLCDGVINCYRGDDEKFCNQVLSPSCAIYELTSDKIFQSKFLCSDQITDVSLMFDQYITNPRILVMDGFGEVAKKFLMGLHGNERGAYLAVISVRNNYLYGFPKSSLVGFPNLRVLDLSGNSLCLKEIPLVISQLPLLSHLISNPIRRRPFCTELSNPGNENSIRSLSVIVDTQLPFTDCCTVSQFTKTTCNKMLGIATCQRLLPDSYKQSLWVLIAVSVGFSILYLTQEIRQRKKDILRFNSFIIMFIGDSLMIAANLVLNIHAALTDGNYFKYHEMTIYCFVLTFLQHFSLIFRYLGSIDNVLLTAMKVNLASSKYDYIRDAHYSLGLFLTIALFSLVTFITDISSISALSDDSLFYFPLYTVFKKLDHCISWVFTQSLYLTLSGLSFVVVLGVSLWSCINFCFKKREPEVTSPEDNLHGNGRAGPEVTSRKWIYFPFCSACLTMFHSSLVFTLCMLSMWDRLTPDPNVLIPLSLFLMASLPCINPIAFLLASMVTSLIDRPKRMSRLKRAGGFSKKPKTHYEKLNVYLEHNGKVTVKEAFSMVTTMAQTLTNFHAEGMVCDSIGTDFIVIGMEKVGVIFMKKFMNTRFLKACSHIASLTPRGGNITELDFVATTEYPKSDVQEWRTKRDVGELGIILENILLGIVPDKGGRLKPKMTKLSQRNKGGQTEETSVE